MAKATQKNPKSLIHKESHGFGVPTHDAVTHLAFLRYSS